MHEDRTDVDHALAVRRMDDPDVVAQLAVL
jgi:hypothetical protein